MIKFANSLYTVAFGYIAISNAILMIRQGRTWSLFRFELGVSLLCAGVSLRGLYAWLTREIAPAGVDYHPVLDDYRGIAYLVFVLLSLVGAYIISTELVQVKRYKKEYVIWAGLFLLAIGMAIP